MSSPLTSYRKAQGQSLEALATTLGVDKATLWRWENKRIPADRVREIERLTGVPRETLRPDLYEAAQ